MIDDLQDFDPRAWHVGGVLVKTPTRAKTSVARRNAAAVTAALTFVLSAASAAAEQPPIVIRPGHVDGFDAAVQAVQPAGEVDTELADPAEWGRLIDLFRRAPRDEGRDPDDVDPRLQCVVREWWQAGLDPRGLSQGDVISPIPFGETVDPPVDLQFEQTKGGYQRWVRATNSKQGLMLFQGKNHPAIVVSHSCDVEKNERNGFVVLAPVKPIANLVGEAREETLQQKRYALMPLLATPGLGDCYADLRRTMAVSRDLVLPKRIGSMTDLGVLRWQVQIARFFTRLSADALEKALAELAQEEARKKARERTTATPSAAG